MDVVKIQLMSTHTFAKYMQLETSLILTMKVCHIAAGEKLGLVWNTTMCTVNPYHAGEDRIAQTKKIDWNSWACAHQEISKNFNKFYARSGVPNNWRKKEKM